MAIPFLSKKTKPRHQVVALDMGTHMTKAVHVQRHGSGYSLVNFALQEAPEKGIVDPDSLGNHLKAVNQSLGDRAKKLVIALGVGDSLLRRAELPMVPVSNMRAMLKLGAKNYLQQDLPNYVFDCSVLPPKAANGEEKEPAKGKPKCQVLVGGARRETVEQVKAGAKLAGMIVEQITPGLVGPANAFEMSAPESFKDAVATLVDIGYKNTSVSILVEGEIILSRVLGFGGHQITLSLANSLGGLGYSEAEGIKVGLSAEVEDNLREVLTPLARELRASIDFFEHQHDKSVDKIFLSGGTARSDFIIQCLQAELLTPCESWNPMNFLNLNVPPARLAEAEACAPQLAVALGVAAAALN